MRETLRRIRGVVQHRSHREPERDGGVRRQLVRDRLSDAPERLLTLGMDGDGRIRVLIDLLNLYELADVPRAWLVNLKVPVEARRAVIEITYSSVYGERWRITSDRLVPVRQ